MHLPDELSPGRRAGQGRPRVPAAFSYSVGASVEHPLSSLGGSKAFQEAPRVSVNHHSSLLDVFVSIHHIRLLLLFLRHCP